MPKSPCFKNGKDCEDRCVGCRKTCEEWQEFEKAKEVDYKKRYNALLQNRAIIEYERAKSKRLRHSK